MVNGIEGFLSGRVLDFEEALPGEKLTYLTHTPGAYLGSCRYKLPESLEDPVYPELFRKFEEMNIGWFSISVEMIPWILSASFPAMLLPTTLMYVSWAFRKRSTTI